MTRTVTVTAGLRHTLLPPGLRYLTYFLRPPLEPGIILTSQHPEAPKSPDSPGSMKLLKNGLAGHTRLPF